MIRVLCLVAVLVLACATPAAAHNVSAGADLRIAQTIAGTELTVVIKGTTRVPGPLRIGVEAFEPVTALPVALEIRSVADGRTVKGVATAAPDPQYTQLTVDRTGPHELTLRAGNEVAVLPFRVLVERAAVGELLIYGGLFLAGLLLVGGLLTGALSRPGPAMLLAGGAAAGVTLAAMVIVFEPMMPARPPDGAAPVLETSAAAGAMASGGRPFAQARVTTVPARPAVGAEFTVRIDLVDGSTGRPVDDLVAHHEALAHLVVTSEDGRYFRHVHPLRTAPGRLEVKLRADRAGRYLAHAELEREDSGGQLLTAEFGVGDDPAAQNPAARNPASQDPASQDSAAQDPAAQNPGVAPVLRPAAPVAGRPVTIELGTAGAVRPWLGMAGHLIVRSQDGSFLGHIHEMGSSGPRLRFTYSFPEAGRYLAWAQYAVADRIVTVPFTVEVAPAEAGR
jgi:hypothetical protein